MLRPEELAAHPHMAARAAFPDLDHPVAGRVRVTAPPFHLDGGPLAPAGPAPYRIGQHTREVLTGLLGYSPERVDSLTVQGAVSTAD